jgi:hypothetical protein
LEASEIALLVEEHNLNPALSAEVAKITGGNALYVRSVCQEMADEGEQILRRLKDQPPRDVNDYFRRQFILLRDSAGDRSLTWKTLVAVTAASEPISGTDLADFLQVSPASLDDALRPVRRYLLPGEDIQFVHVLLGRRVSQAAGQPELAQTRADLVAWGDRLVLDRGRLADYVLRSHAGALRDLGRKQDLVSLITPRWIRAHRQLDASL